MALKEEEMCTWFSPCWTTTAGYVSSKPEGWIKVMEEPPEWIMLPIKFRYVLFRRRTVYIYLCKFLCQRLVWGCPALLTNRPLLCLIETRPTSITVTTGTSHWLSTCYMLKSRANIKHADLWTRAQPAKQCLKTEGTQASQIPWVALLGSLNQREQPLSLSLCIVWILEMQENRRS